MAEYLGFPNVGAVMLPFERGLGEQMKESGELQRAVPVQERGSW